MELLGCCKLLQILIIEIDLETGATKNWNNFSAQKYIFCTTVRSNSPKIKQEKPKGMQLINLDRSGREKASDNQYLSSKSFWMTEQSCGCHRKAWANTAPHPPFSAEHQEHLLPSCQHFFKQGLQRGSIPKFYLQRQTTLNRSVSIQSGSPPCYL